MSLASLLVLAGVVLAPAVQDQKPPHDPKQVDAAVAELEAAFKDGQTAEQRIAAIKKNSAVIDARVVAAIDKGVKDKDKAVQSAAVDALGRMPHPDALEALHKFYRADQKRLKDDDKLLPLLFKSIGRHGSEKSIEILSDDLFMQRTHGAIQSRVWALGNIRSKKSVEALMAMMNKAGTRQVDDYMTVFRPALMRLTGGDQGPSSQMWMTWWRENEKKFELPTGEPKLPEELTKLWNEYWEIQPKKEPPKEGGEKKGG